jgi:cytochrome c553
MKKLALVFILCSPLVIYAQENIQTVENKAQVCVACHGPKGISLTPQWPNLAGQHKKYLVKQLNDLKEGKLRSSPTMAPMIAPLNEQDIDDLAAYYAKMPVGEGSTPKKFLQRGEQLYRGGDFNKHITACIAGFPVLSGQHAAYTMRQLQEFKEGKRTNDLNHIMQDISSRMDPDDMEAVAHYIEGLY